MQTTSEFDITNLSVRDFKKLLTDIKDKETFESNLLKQVKLNIDFWSYLLIYDDIVNEGNMIVSEQLLDHAADIFLIEWYEIQDEQISLAQFVLDKLEMDFEEVQAETKKRILYNASFGSYLYFSLKEFSNVDDV